MLEHIFPGHSEMAGRMRALDWEGFGAGPPEHWPENLRIALSLCLTSRYPMQVWWGRDLAMLYNDAYIPYVGSQKHPGALGRSAREMWSDVWHQIGPMIEGVFSQGTASASEDIRIFFERDHEHTESYVSFSFSPIFGVGSGKSELVEGVFCTSTDTTEKVVAARLLAARAQELAQSEERYRRLFASAPMAVFVCDREAVIQHYNARAVELWGREPVSGREKHCGSAKLWLPDGTFLPHHQSPMVEVLRTGVPVHNVEVAIERPDGSRLPVLVNFAALTDQQGEVTGAITSFNDITERKQAEAELHDSARRKNEFLAMLAHELRNPLASIRNGLRIVRVAADKDESLESVTELMERQLAQMIRLVDDLLDVSRITRGKIELRKERLDLASAVNHAIESARPTCESLKHDFIVALPAYPMILEGDPVRLTQIVGNLLTNACKFTQPGGRIWLTLERESQHAVIRVRDNGIGMAADHLPGIFDMFSQVDSSLERSQTGLGIGLSLVKDLVEMHGGTVEAHSAGLDLGTEFVVRLPIEDEAPEPVQPATTPRAQLTLMPKRILVVDDNRDSAISMSMLLQIANHTTQTAYDGLEAVQAAESFKPDVVLLDLGLPKLNGYEAARRIRAHSWGEKIVLVAVTGWGHEEDRQKSKDAGFDGHIVKPANHDDLMELLAALFLERQSGQNGPVAGPEDSAHNNVPTSCT